MSFHPSNNTLSASTKLDDPDDLLLSYLNVDCLDTSNTPATSTESFSDSSITQSPSSISSYEDSLSPMSRPYSSSWSSLPFLLNVNALANACMSPSSDLITGISPCSISRVDDPSFSTTDMSPFIATVGANALVSQLSDTLDYQHSFHPSVTKSSSASPTISTVSSVSSVSSSSSDMEEPKRKRERKKQQHGSSKRTVTTSTQQQLSSMALACKPILPAQRGNHASSTASDQCSHSNKHHWSSNLVTIKPEPMDYSPALTCLDGNAGTKNPQQQNHHGSSDQKGTITTTHTSATKTNAVDAHSKRQERLIKNRAAALLSRKRKREHLQALEQERQWLVKDNEVFKSKTAILEAKIQQLEQENEAQKQQVLLLQKQPQQVSFDEEEEEHFTTMDPLSKVTNVLMVRS